MNEEPLKPAPARYLGKLIFLIVVIGLVALVYRGWRNQHQDIAEEIVQITPKPTPSYSASASAKASLPLDLVTGTKTSKGGLVLADTDTEPTVVTPTPSPKPNEQESANSDEKQPTTASLDRIYLDSQFSYSIRFPHTWVFRRTHGTNTGADSTEILSRITLSYPQTTHPQAEVTVVLRSASGQTDLETWLDQYTKLEFASATKTKFHDLPAALYSNLDSNRTEKLFFLHGAYAYELIGWKQGQFGSEMLAIRNSFNP